MQVLAISAILFVVCSAQIDGTAPSPDHALTVCSACEVAIRTLDDELHKKPTYWIAQRTYSLAHEAVEGLCDRVHHKAAIGLTRKHEWHYIGKSWTYHADHYVRVHAAPNVHARMVRQCKTLTDKYHKEIAQHVVQSFDRNIRNAICFRLSKSCSFEKHVQKELKFDATGELEEHTEVAPGVHLPHDLDMPPPGLDHPESLWTKVEPRKREL